MTKDYADAYADILISRMKYFRDKKITELTTEEAKEYVNLQEEIDEIMLEIKDVWERIEPYYKAGKTYQERVLNRE